jgi:hypothetical protein
MSTAAARKIDLEFSVDLALSFDQWEIDVEILPLGWATLTER